MKWLTEILTIYLEEQLLINYYIIKHYILLKFQTTMDVNLDFLQRKFGSLADKTASCGDAKSAPIFCI